MASDRYSISSAPGPLESVQDFLNTVSAGRTVRGPDLLATVEDANEWLEGMWGAHSVVPFQPLAEADLAPLRRVRAVLAMVLSGERAAADESLALPGVRVSLVPGENGIELRPDGAGWKRVASLLLARLHDAQVAGTARRLKICPNEWCRVSFYDRSKNNSAVWHDPASCGNIVNVRASRARKRAQHERLSAN